MVVEYLQNEAALVRAMLARLADDVNDGPTWCAMADLLSEGGETGLTERAAESARAGDPGARCGVAMLAALASCDPLSTCALESIWWAPHYCGPAARPESPGIFLGNWNATDRYDPETRTRVDVDDTPPVLGRVLAALGAEIEWSDEWDQCDDCQGAVRIEPDGFDWEPFFTVEECRRDGCRTVCHSCRDRAAREERVGFFWSEAGWSLGFGETEQQARQRCAEALADAEEWFLSQENGSVEWLEDGEADRSWLDDEDTGPEGGDDGRTLWGCVVRVGGRVVSLWSIDLGTDGSPSGPAADPYTRVVVAELAAELMADPAAG